MSDKVLNRKFFEMLYSEKPAEEVVFFIQGMIEHSYIYKMISEKEKISWEKLNCNMFYKITKIPIIMNTILKGD